MKILISGLIILASFGINNFYSSLYIAPSNNAYNNGYTKILDTDNDETEFNFRYGNKIWTYKVENVNVDQFDINFELTKYNKNNKKQKINLINYMKNLGFNNEIIIKYLFPNLIKKINLVKNNIEKPPKDAEINIISVNKININKEIVGIKLNYNLLLKNILNNYPNSDRVNLNVPVQKVDPQVLYDDLKKCTNLRSSFSTSFKSSIPERKHNIRQAVKKIHGKVLEPGEEFSFNKIVGRRTSENGYKMAKIIYNGNFIDGIGGGVCQVSSTLYNAVLMSGLEVKKSSKHSERISYVKPGFDAMVNYGSSDLVFKNNTNNKIYILADAKNDRLSISILGENLKGYEYKLKSEVVDVVPYDAEEILVDFEEKYLDKVQYSDEYFYLKKACSGCTIKSYREVYSNGCLVKTELLRTDKYQPQRAVKVIGSKSRPLN